MSNPQPYSPSPPAVAILMESDPSHTFASLGVARRLQRIGYDVEYWGSATNRAEGIIRDGGFRYCGMESLWSRFREDIRLPPHLNSWQLLLQGPMLAQKLRKRRALRRQLTPNLEQCRREFDQLLLSLRPAFVVVDPFLLAYYPFLWKHGVPTVALSTKALPTYDPNVPPYDCDLLPPRTLADRARVRLCWANRRIRDVKYRAVRRLARAAGAYTYGDLLTEAARQTGFPLRRELVNRWVQPDLHFRSLHEWALWLPETDLPRDRALPANLFYIGPSVDTRREGGGAASMWWDATDRYRIYIAVGTVSSRWRQNVPFLARAMAAFADRTDVQVVMSTSDERAAAELGTPPSNIKLLDFVPQLEVLRDADLVITHAGAGTYREGIHYEVPMLAYPRNNDQLGNSTRIVYHGIGLRGDRERDTPNDIREKAYRILTEGDGFRRNLRRLKAATSDSEPSLLLRALQHLPGGMPAALCAVERGRTG